MRTSKKICLGFLGAVSFVVGVPASYAGILQWTGNVHTIEPNVLYRSGQLDGDELDALVGKDGIRSILNLRRINLADADQRSENLVVAADGLDFYSIPISANKEPDMATMKKIVEVMRTAPKPMLVHCRGGADRSGLAAALFEYAVQGQPVDKAIEQLSFIYGHFPWLWSRTGAMDRAFTNFTSNWVASDQSKGIRVTHNSAEEVSR